MGAVLGSTMNAEFLTRKVNLAKLKNENLEMTVDTKFICCFINMV